MQVTDDVDLRPVILSSIFCKLQEFNSRNQNSRKITFRENERHMIKNSKNKVSFPQPVPDLLLTVKPATIVCKNVLEIVSTHFPYLFFPSPLNNVDFWTAQNFWNTEVVIVHIDIGEGGETACLALRNIENSSFRS